MSYVTGAHAFKVGFSDTWARTVSTTESNSSYMMFRFNHGSPNQLTHDAVPTRGESLAKGEIGSSRRTAGKSLRWTLTAGIRYDEFIGGYPEQERGPAPLQPTRDFTVAASPDEPEGRDAAAGCRLLPLRRPEDRAEGERLGGYVLGVRRLAILPASARRLRDPGTISLFPAGDPSRGNFVPTAIS